MPPRFRRSEPMATFELVPDDERDEDAPPSPGEESGDDGRSARQVAAAARDRAVELWRRLSRRGRIAVAAGTAVVVLAASAAAVAPGLLDAREQRLRAEAVQGLPGAVEDLSEPLTETWEISEGNGLITTFPGGVALTSDGTDVWAVDAATGHEVWRQDVGTNPVCGPQAYEPVDLGRPVDVVVCLGGEPRARTVTVVDASGTVVGERAIGAAEDDLYPETADADAPFVVPAADGAIAVVDDDLSTGVTAPWTDDGSADGAAALRTLRANGWVDPTLRVEDALTGEVRAEVTAHLRPEHLDGCNQSFETVDGETEGSLAPVVSVDVSRSFAVLSACSAVAGVTAEGAELDTSAASGWPQAAVGGGYVFAGEESSVLAPDGSLVTTVPGWVFLPALDVDPDGSYLAITGLDGSEALRLSSVGRDGAPGWSVELDEFSGFSVVAARVAGAVVLQDGARVVGIDAETGTELWARDGLLDRSADGSGEWVVGALTDGTRVLLGIDGSDGGHRLVALDVRDGTTAWERTVAGPLNALYAIDGHPVTEGNQLHGLGAS